MLVWLKLSLVSFTWPKQQNIKYVLEPTSSLKSLLVSFFIGSMSCTWPAEKPTSRETLSAVAVRGLKSWHVGCVPLYILLSMGLLRSAAWNNEKYTVIKSGLNDILTCLEKTKSRDCDKNEFTWLLFAWFTQPPPGDNLSQIRTPEMESISLLVYRKKHQVFKLNSLNTQHKHLKNFVMCHLLDVGIYKVPTQCFCCMIIMDCDTWKITIQK